MSSGGGCIVVIFEAIAWHCGHGFVAVVAGVVVHVNVWVGLVHAAFATVHTLLIVDDIVLIHFIYVSIAHVACVFAIESRFVVRCAIIFVALSRTRTVWLKLAIGGPVAVVF